MASINKDLAESQKVYFLKLSLDVSLFMSQNIFLKTFKSHGDENGDRWIRSGQFNGTEA